MTATKLSALGFCALASSTMAATISGPISNPANGHTYYLLASDTWTNSEAQAVALGGHLVTINDAAENDFVYNTFGATPQATGRLLWLGYNDAASEGNFVWSSGENPGYTHWYPNQPDNGGSSSFKPQNYALMFGAYTFGGAARFWDDDTGGKNGEGNSYPVNGVVEVVPEPATALTAVLGAGLLLARKRRRA